MKKTSLLALALALFTLLGACSSGGNMASTTSPSTTAAAASTTAASAGAGNGWGSAPTGVPQGNEQYLDIRPNAFQLAEDVGALTFSLKVDTAAYSNVARYLRAGQLPPPDAVRSEELINYFSYDAVLAESREHPFAIYTEIGPSPFDAGRNMAFIRVRSRDIDRASLPASNLIFLIDTSGSMNSHDKLPLLQQALTLLVENLGEDDTVGIVTYAGSSKVALRPTSDRGSILDAIEGLTAGGSTAGANGIQTAYELAEGSYLAGGNNRIILATDGDFNVGPSSTNALSELVREKKESGIYLSILGFGTGNIRDDIMETLSKDGSGNYAYIDSADTAKKVLVDELGANLYTIADDVKAQVEFNPQNVKSYRLIGYENRQLDNQDFANDAKDAGEVGAGTDVILLFEFEPVDAAWGGEGMKYQQSAGLSQPSGATGPFADELFEVRLRYKDPGANESKLMTAPVTFGSYTGQSSSDYGFACAVAAFAEKLRGTEYGAALTADEVSALAKANLGRDEQGYRLEFLLLLEGWRRMEGNGF